MDSMEDKIGNILQNPEMMQKIMAMAQSLNSAPQQEQPKEQQKEQQAPPIPDIDIGTLQKISGLAKHGSIDNQQQALLRALHPYLSRQRIHKLENAMRAAKMAKIAASVLGPQGINLPFSR